MIVDHQLSFRFSKKKQKCNYANIGAWHKGVPILGLNLWLSIYMHTMLCQHLHDLVTESIHPCPRHLRLRHVQAADARSQALTSPEDDARSDEVLWSMFLESAFVPRWSSKRTLSVWPLAHARCNGVHPVFSLEFAFAPRSSNRR